MSAQFLRGDRPRPDWYAEANCKGQTALMYDFSNPEAALSLCAACEVREPCREQGRADREHGTWGGETEVQRHRIGRGNPINVDARNAVKRQDGIRPKRRPRRRAVEMDASGRPAWRIVELRERRRTRRQRRAG